MAFNDHVNAANHPIIAFKSEDSFDLPYTYAALNANDMLAIAPAIAI